MIERVNKPRTWICLTTTTTTRTFNKFCNEKCGSWVLIYRWGQHCYFLFASFLSWTSHRQMMMSVIRPGQILSFVPKSECIVINRNIKTFLIFRAFEDYTNAFQAGNDGRPDWLARKSCNLMTAVVEVSQFEVHVSTYFL